MSNLYKYIPVDFETEEKRIIDSNAILEDIVNERYAELKRQQEALLADEEGDEPKKFVEGLSFAEVDMNDYSEEGGIVFQDSEEDDQGIDGEEMIASGMEIPSYDELADDILAEANQRAEEIIAEAKAEAESIRQRAEEEGFKQGMKNATDTVEAENAALREDLERQRIALEEAYQEKVKDIEPQLVSVIADIYEKVFSIQFAEKRELLLNLVKNAVNQIENSKEFLIKVPKDNLQFVMDHKDELQEQVGQYVTIEIISDNELTDNMCVIHTDSGVFDCSLDIQLDNLTRDLKSLSLDI